MNYGIYSVLKKLTEGSELSSYDQYILERACQKHEEELERRHAIQAEKAEKIKGLILLVLNHADKALTPTDMQFDIYRAVNEEIPCQAIAWYAVQLTYFDNKLNCTHKRNKTYYTIKKENKALL